MKIATWNLQRLERGNQQYFIGTLNELQADVLVLTETNASVELNDHTSISTDSLPPGYDGISYRPGECRVSVLTKYKVLLRHMTFDPFTAVCVEVESPFGPILIYGGIVGVFGNRQPRFNSDLDGQLDDFEKLFPGKLVCYAGDLNVTFSGKAWPSTSARQKLNNAFAKYNLVNVTGNCENSVDHIVVSEKIYQAKKIEVNKWEDKKRSDHMGVSATFL